MQKSRPTQLVSMPPLLVDERAEGLVGTVTVLTGPEPGQSFAIEAGRSVIGRSTDVAISIDDPGISRCHAAILQERGRYFIEDLKSTNGTYLNNERLSGRWRLLSGMRIQLGTTTVLRFAVKDKLEQQASQRMYQMSVRDPLTGLYNRRYFEDRLESEMAYMRRHKTPTCIMVIDVDHFKQVNDTEGHAAGDEALCKLALALSQGVRTEDVIARLGGEEIVVLARGIELEGAHVLAERLRQTVEKLDVRWGGKRIPLTVSIGLAHTDVDPRLERAEAIVAAADGALYRAKRGGRNRIEVAPPRVSEPAPKAPGLLPSSRRPWDNMTTPKDN